MSCPDCRSIAPLEDRGTIRYRLVQEPGLVSSYPYDSRETLLDLLSGLQDRHAEGEDAEISVIPEGPANTPLAGSSWLPLSVWQARVRHSDLIRIIRDRQFTSHMQPIVDLRRNGALYGYEMLLRSMPHAVPFQPYELFRAAQETGFHSFLDRAARISAIETGAKHLGRGLKRFVNFLPSSIYNPEYCLTHTFQAIREFDQDPADFVFEVVETERIVDIPKLASIFSVYKENGMKVALDDVGAGYSTLDVLVSLKPDYVKIDREVVRFCDQVPERRRDLEAIVGTARSVGATVLAEGIERPEELEVCRSAGVDLAQGYLLGKPSPNP
ncbi:EAL domain-containing protein [Gorillibacterium sp. sgz5001074]|uniref:EAL domain-containing protein n=1 Tax=Gorillibacterium sp. sgz5001074 TaxID=3446695 RepID=UPI003F67143D